MANGDFLEVAFEMRSGLRIYRQLKELCIFAGMKLVRKMNAHTKGGVCTRTRVWRTEGHGGVFALSVHCNQPINTIISQSEEAFLCSVFLGGNDWTQEVLCNLWSFFQSFGGFFGERS